jgi:hypothetical protein
MTIRTATLLRQVGDALRAAFPEVEFRLSVPDWSRRRGNRRCIMIYWCGDPPDAAVEAVAAKYHHHGVHLMVDGHVPCQLCGKPTLSLKEGLAVCVHCDPDLWGCRGEEASAAAAARYAGGRL